MAQNAPIFDQTCAGVPLTSTLRDNEAADVGDAVALKNAKVEEVKTAAANLANICVILTGGMVGVLSMQSAVRQLRGETSFGQRVRSSSGTEATPIQKLNSRPRHAVAASD
jgi:hypothetical protein